MDLCQDQVVSQDLGFGTQLPMNGQGFGAQGKGLFRGFQGQVDLCLTPQVCADLQGEPQLLVDGLGLFVELQGSPVVPRFPVLLGHGLDVAGFLRPQLGAPHLEQGRVQDRKRSVLIAQGRDAADVAISNTFGVNELTKFLVFADEVVERR